MAQLMAQSKINNKNWNWIPVSKSNAITELVLRIAEESVKAEDRILRIKALLSGETIGTELSYYKIVDIDR